MKCSLVFLLGLCFVLLTSCEERERFPQGKILYENFCANCHMEDGSGLEGVIPTLVNADWVRENQLAIPCAIRYGMAGEITVNGRVYNAEMPGAPKLHEFEITNIINYINTSWGNDIPLLKHEQVREQLEACRK
jgi:mono/diheme cytochrome c family protein